MIEQGSPEWHALRCGKATASRIADIVRKTKTGISASRERYLGELVAQRLTGIVPDGYKSADMDWGNQTEPLACDTYAFVCNIDPEPIDFVDHPSIPMSGASPDRLVGSDGLLEIKCPATHTHIATLRGAPIDPDYIVQMQWQMACTGRQWCDWVSFDPRLPEALQFHIVRVPRDAARIAELEDATRKFLADVDAAVADLTKIATQRRAA